MSRQRARNVLSHSNSAISNSTHHNIPIWSQPLSTHRRQCNTRATSTQHLHQCNTRVNIGPIGPPSTLCLGHLDFPLHCPCQSGGWWLLSSSQHRPPCNTGKTIEGSTGDPHLPISPV